jgi:hypothetical protein
MTSGLQTLRQSRLGWQVTYGWLRSCSQAGRRTLRWDSFSPIILTFPDKLCIPLLLAICFDVASRTDCARTEPQTLDVAPQFGMGPMPFIMFLLCMAGVGMCCCFINRKRLLEWAASGGQGEYDEIYDD